MSVLVVVVYQGLLWIRGLDMGLGISTALRIIKKQEWLATMFY